MHRITTWFTEDGDPVQVEVACLDSSWECVAAVCEPVGPFHLIEEATETALAVAHGLGGWRAHQREFTLG